jgi:hypothetical protein
MWRSALAAPLRKGSAPITSTSGRRAAWAAMCSPPPKPISSQASAASGASDPWIHRPRRRIERKARQQGLQQRRLARLDRAALDSAV